MDLVAELAGLIGADAVLTAPTDLEAVTEDWRGRYRGAALCLARPANTEEVAAVVRACARHGVPVLPQGGNTSLCGGAVPSAEGPAPVILSLARLRKVRAIDPVNNTIEVEAGCVLATVQEAAAAAGRLYPVSLGAEGSCQIGGTIATNAGGTSVLRYGNTRDNVLGLEVVLPDGAVWSGLYGLRKNNTGYDLKHLFIGSEGTLGVVTAAVLKLHPLPTRHANAWVGLSSPEAALELLTMVQESSGASLTAFELINQLQLDLVVEHVPNRRSPIGELADWHVLIELAGNGAPGVLDAELQAILERAFEKGLLVDAALAASEAQRIAMWDVRHSVSEANKKGGVGLTTDCAVPLSAVPAFIESATAAVRRLVPGLPMVVVAHIGDGNVHFIPFFTFEAWRKVTDTEALAAAIRHAVNDEAARLKGTFSAEHGIGRTLVPEMARYKPPAELTLMRAIKQAIDPQNLFNPGRLLPPA
ncbi:FAD/FMN-containing dehydrogenase [Azospirillum agricola]|uniref:FAD-binding oxidoreductase n=1 Tax=Azospirillum agricola TaxID=1720247 RepID=UPI001AE46F5D|nr:FAD-linked oxidase C-terminal domain-containing protein [Azospirillum agricola]MBP2232423.1 FAD/FMN-containing dehydrogenase [Azospirillum agricola]